MSAQALSEVFQVAFNEALALFNCNVLDSLEVCQVIRQLWCNGMVSDSQAKAMLFDLVTALKARGLVVHPKITHFVELLEGKQE